MDVIFANARRSFPLPFSFSKELSNMRCSSTGMI